LTELRWECEACFQRKKRASRRAQQSPKEVDNDVDMETSDQYSTDGSPEAAEGFRDEWRQDEAEDSEYMHTASNNNDATESDSTAIHNCCVDPGHKPDDP
jgi:hypothetical protein